MKVNELAEFGRRRPHRYGIYGQRGEVVLDGAYSERTPAPDVQSAHDPKEVLKFYAQLALMSSLFLRADQNYYGSTFHNRGDGHGHCASISGGCPGVGHVPACSLHDAS
jgi:hypothetical protein